MDDTGKRPLVSSLEKERTRRLTFLESQRQKYEKNRQDKGVFLCIRPLYRLFRTVLESQCEDMDKVERQKVYLKTSKLPVYHVYTCHPSKNAAHPSKKRENCSVLYLGG